MLNNAFNIVGIATVTIATTPFIDLLILFQIESHLKFSVAQNLTEVIIVVGFGATYFICFIVCTSCVQTVCYKL